jgi:single-strand DNA-binding protein
MASFLGNTGYNFNTTFRAAARQIQGDKMAALNRIQLIGYLGKDPETRVLPSGSKVCAFSVAVDRRWKNGGGETKEAVDWFLVEAWGRRGEICQEYLHKGRLVFVEGRMQNDRWQDENGDPHSRSKVVALQMQILDRKPEEPEMNNVAESEQEPEPELEPA